MTMDSILHQYLTKLRIISKIPEHGKLDTTQNDLNIYYGTIINWVWRKFNGDSKDCTTKFLVSLFREINSFSDQLMYNIITEKNPICKNRKMTMLVSLTEKIKESLTGIRNLIGTYKDYLKVVSVLECLEQDIIIPQYHTLKKFTPIEYQTEILKTEISYSHIHMSTGMIIPRLTPTTPELDMNFPGYTPPSQLGNINNIVESPQTTNTHRYQQHSYTTPSSQVSNILHQTNIETEDLDLEQSNYPTTSTTASATTHTTINANPGRSPSINIPDRKSKPSKKK
jgi:hypothetical protein